jgi:hypothetical protein
MAYTRAISKTRNSVYSLRVHCNGGKNTNVELGSVRRASLSERRGSTGDGGSDNNVCVAYVRLHMTVAEDLDLIAILVCLSRVWLLSRRK